MKLKISSFALMAIGVLLVGYAFVMDISIGGDVVNLGLLNTRQNLVMLGGLGILGGVILFATSMLVKDGAQKEAEDLAAAKLKLVAARTNAEAMLNAAQQDAATKIDRIKAKAMTFHDQMLPLLKVVSWLSFVAPLFGLYTLAFFLATHRFGTSYGYLWLSLAMIYAPYGLRKYRKRK